MKKIKTVYFDMDGVQADFNKVFSQDNYQMMFEEGFFLNLEVIGEPNRVQQIVKNMGYNVRILSACVDSPYCRREKMEWIKKHLPNLKDNEIILCNVGENKADYVEDITTSVLIDDYGKNLKQWYNAGGYPIKFAPNNRKERKCKFVTTLMEVPSILIEMENERV